MGILKSLAGFFLSEGDKVPQVRPGRNEECWCGSGKKYKRCHLQDDEVKLQKNRSLNCGTS